MAGAFLVSEAQNRRQCFPIMHHANAKPLELRGPHGTARVAVRQGITGTGRVVVRILNIAAVLGAVLIGVTLWAWGQPLTSTSGEFRFWVGNVWSGENSQQVADWYTLSHIIHGMLVAFIGRLLAPWVTYPMMLAAAIGTGVAWEIVEHTDWVLGKFRATTIYQGYLGDTVLNAVADYVFMMGGFFFASAVTLRWVVAVILAFEVAAAAIARDSLALSTLSVVYPIEAVEAWQNEHNPRNQEPGN